MRSGKSSWYLGCHTPEKSEPGGPACVNGNAPPGGSCCAPAVATPTLTTIVRIAGTRTVNRWVMISISYARANRNIDRVTARGASIGRGREPNSLFYMRPDYG